MWNVCKVSINGGNKIPEAVKVRCANEHDLFRVLQGNHVAYIEIGNRNSVLLARNINILHSRFKSSFHSNFLTSFPILLEMTFKIFILNEIY